MVSDCRTLFIKVMDMEKQNYGGLDNEFTSYKDAKIVVLPVPL